MVRFLPIRFYFLFLAGLVLISCGQETENGTYTEDIQHESEEKKFGDYFHFLEADTLLLNLDSEYDIAQMIINPPNGFETESDVSDDSIIDLDSLEDDLDNLWNEIETTLEYEEEWIQKNGEVSQKIPETLRPEPAISEAGYSLAEIALPGELQGYLVTNASNNISLLTFKDDAFLEILNLTGNSFERQDSLVCLSKKEAWIEKNAREAKIWCMENRLTYDPISNEMVSMNDTVWFKTLVDNHFIKQTTPPIPSSLRRSMEKKSETAYKKLESYRNLYQTTNVFDIMSDTLHIHKGLKLWEGYVPYERTFYDRHGYLQYMLTETHPGFFSTERFPIETEYYGLFRLQLWSIESFQKRYMGFVILTENRRVDLVITDGIHVVNRVPMAWKSTISGGKRITESWIFRDDEADTPVILQKWGEIQWSADAEEYKTGTYRFKIDDQDGELKEEYYWDKNADTLFHFSGNSGLVF